MSRTAQVLSIEPTSELVFKGPFNDVVTCQMRLTNPTERQVKTTAPKQYCVRPNSGVLSPGETCNVAVMLQPFDASSNVEMEHTKHKFLIQSVYAPPGNLSLGNIWKNAQPSELMDSKLRVVFEYPPAAGCEGDKTPPRMSPESKSAAGGYTANMDVEVRRVIEEKNRVEVAKTNLERENNNLKARLAALETIPQVTGSQASESGITVSCHTFVCIFCLCTLIYYKDQKNVVVSCHTFVCIFCVCTLIYYKDQKNVVVFEPLPLNFSDQCTVYGTAKMVLIAFAALMSGLIFGKLF
uniref:Major sperm protein n=1 Tax=Wuchereria bancrofti TaxID=6293 RepID=A0A1I8EST1_WUCBA